MLTELDLPQMPSTEKWIEFIGIALEAAQFHSGISI